MLLPVKLDGSSIGRCPLRELFRCLLEFCRSASLKYIQKFPYHLALTPEKQLIKVSYILPYGKA